MFEWQSPEHKAEIPLHYVKENGLQVYPYKDNPTDPDIINLTAYH